MSQIMRDMPCQRGKREVTVCVRRDEILNATPSLSNVAFARGKGECYRWNRIMIHCLDVKFICFISWKRSKAREDAVLQSRL